jgi:hypothetical protein
VVITENCKNRENRSVFYKIQTPNFTNGVSLVYGISNSDAKSLVCSKFADFFFPIVRSNILAKRLTKIERRLSRISRSPPMVSSLGLPIARSHADFVTFASQFPPCATVSIPAPLRCLAIYLLRPGHQNYRGSSSPSKIYHQITLPHRRAVCVRQC